MEEDYVKKWMAIKELQERNRCIKCKRPLDKFVICDRCLEFKYCSVHCLEDDRDDHLTFCNVIGLMKGRLTRVTNEESERIGKLKGKARLLNEDGTIRIPQRGAKDEGENTSEKEGNGRDNGSVEPKEKEQEETESDDKSVKNLMAGGKFGGAARVDQKLQSGLNFGEGWWSPSKTEFSRDQTTTDADSVNSEDKLNYTSEEHGATALQASTSAETHLEKALSEMQIVKYDPKQAGDRARSYSTHGQCFFCGTKGPVLKCSRCKIATYCGKSCQKSDFKEHSNKCKVKERFDKAISKVPQELKLASILAMGSFNVSPFLAALPNEFEYMMLGPRCHVMVEIVSEHPHPFRFGAYVKDAMGVTTQVLFYTDTPFYTHRVPGMFGLRLPIPLSRCIKPGNFMLILEAHWHHFLDGTRGIRVDDVGDVFFVFMDK